MQDPSIRIDKLVHGGQAMGTMPDGRKAFVWNALPGETVRVQVTKARRDYVEAIAEEISQPSPDRVAPRDEAYLSTSPWQIMTFDAENTHKRAILAEALAREKVSFCQDHTHDIQDDFGAACIPFTAPDDPWEYRNKMEYSFWGDEDGLHLALFHRGSHGKRIVQGSSIARPEIDVTANKVCDILQQQNIRASQLKTLVVRCSQDGATVAALFVKDESMSEIPALANVCNGMVVYFSNPKSPASVITKTLYSYGDITLVDKIQGKSISYDVNSFFQVNVPIFVQALKQIDTSMAQSDYIVDMYCGVGTIGLSVHGTKVMVDNDAINIAMAKQNVAKQNIQVVLATSERAVEYITPEAGLVIDPPRAGLHKDVIYRIQDVRPKRIAYLSCNPSTQARDLALLQNLYDIKLVAGYNFFPRTPHIESLSILELKDVK